MRTHARTRSIITGGDITPSLRCSVPSRPDPLSLLALLPTVCGSGLAADSALQLLFRLNPQKLRFERGFSLKLSPGQVRSGTSHRSVYVRPPSSNHVRALPTPIPFPSPVTVVGKALSS